MFVIVRIVDGATETLKASNSYLDKTFTDFSAATLLAQKLNLHTNSRMHWSVKQI